MQYSMFNGTDHPDAVREIELQSKIVNLNATIERQSKIVNPKNLQSTHIFLLYCPPTSNSAFVISPREQTFVASISTEKTFLF